MDDLSHLIDPSEDLYDILKVDKKASQKIIKIAYKKLSMKYHPDRKTGDEEIFKEVQGAYDILGNVNRRAYYDRIRAEYESICNDPSWMSGSEEAREPKREGFFDNIVNKNLRDFIIDSLFLFQRELKIIIPDPVMDDFHSAVEYVYGTWHALQEETPESEKKLLFGGMVLPRRRVDKLLSNDELMS
jgi:curved DNA-binding protein CbpA